MYKRNEASSVASPPSKYDTIAWWPSVKGLTKRSPCGVIACMPHHRKTPSSSGDSWGTGRAVSGTRDVPQVRSQALLGCGNIIPYDPAGITTHGWHMHGPKGANKKKMKVCVIEDSVSQTYLIIMSPSPLYRTLYYLESLGSPKIPLGKCRPSTMTKIK